MLPLILAFILGGCLGYSTIPSLSYECKPLPALEFKSISYPKCLNTCPHLGIWANSRTGKDMRNLELSQPVSAGHHISSFIGQHHQDFSYYMPQQTVTLVSTHVWVRDHSWACFLHCVYRMTTDEALESEHQWMHNVHPGYLASAGLHQGWCKASSGESWCVTSLVQHWLCKGRCSTFEILLGAGDGSDHQLLNLPIELIRFDWWAV